MVLPKFAEISTGGKYPVMLKYLRARLPPVQLITAPVVLNAIQPVTIIMSTAANGGFDDVAASLGWTLAGPPNAGKWDTLKLNFPDLVNLATIGCESCHGAGSEHSMGVAISKIQISNESGVCAQCHDEPWRHNKYSEWENSLHSEALWSSSFAQAAASQNNNLQNCIRCHDAKGYINFTKGLTTNTTGMVEAAIRKSCSTCHDPHGNNNTASLRNTPAGSDTLSKRLSVYSWRLGKTCMNCHKARRDNVTYVQTNVTSSHWGLIIQFRVM
jgi:hypothetical protein